MPDDKMELEKERLTGLEIAFEVVKAVGVSAGLALLWTMEAVRDRFFRLLDRWHVPSLRWRKPSAFPPGPTRG